MWLIEENNPIKNHENHIITGNNRNRNENNYSILQLAKLRNKKCGKRRQRRYNNGI